MRRWLSAAWESVPLLGAVVAYGALIGYAVFFVAVMVTAAVVLDGSDRTGALLMLGFLLVPWLLIWRSTRGG